MKKKIILSLLAVLAIIAGYFVYQLTLSKVEHIKPIYLVPDDAVFVIETERPIDTWDEISSSPAWAHLQTNAYFSELTESLNTLDKTFQEQKKFLNVIGERDITIAVHVTKPKKYDLLYVVGLEELSRLKFFQNSIANMAGKDYKLTKRLYKEHEILELYNTKERKTVYLTFIKDQLLASFTHVLIEKSISQYQEPILGRDLNFAEVNEQVYDDGFFKLFVQHKYLKKYLACFTDQADTPLINDINKSIYFTGLNVGVKEGTIIQAEGFSNLNPETASYLQVLQESGKGKRSISTIAPVNTSLYLNIAFDGFDNFHENFENRLKKHPKEYTQYQKQIADAEKMLGISVKENIFSWIGDEIGILHINSTIAKSKKESAALVFKANDITEANKNLKYLVAKIKEETPLKFRQIPYKGFNIHYLDLKGFFKMIVGNMFSKMEKPYFTIIDDYVVFSNSPNILKEIISNKLLNNTLSNNTNFTDFNDQFNSKTNAFVYINSPYAYDNLIAFADSKTRRKIQKNKKYITCFSQLGMQFTVEDNIVESYISANYEDPKQVNQQVQTNLTKVKEALADKSADSIPTVDSFFKLAEIFPTDLSASEYKEYYENKKLKFEVELKNGLKHGDYKEYYSNGNLKIEGSFKRDKQVSTWRGYDEKEKQIFKKRF